MTRTWRSYATPLIRQVLKDNAGKTDKEIRKALREAYPWGERAMHPYKIWCDEIKVQLGKKLFGKKKKIVLPDNQVNLF
jgi:hypothetical protein